MKPFGSRKSAWLLASALLLAASAQADTRTYKFRGTAISSLSLGTSGASVVGTFDWDPRAPGYDMAVPYMRGYVFDRPANIQLRVGENRVRSRDLFAVVTDDTGQTGGGDTLEIYSGDTLGLLINGTRHESAYISCTLSTEHPGNSAWDGTDLPRRVVLEKFSYTYCGVYLHGGHEVALDFTLGEIKRVPD